jgi:hypothetical protein
MNSKGKEQMAKKIVKLCNLIVIYGMWK